MGGGTVPVTEAMIKLVSGSNYTWKVQGVKSGKIDVEHLHKRLNRDIADPNSLLYQGMVELIGNYTTGKSLEANISKLTKDIENKKGRIAGKTLTDASGGY